MKAQTKMIAASLVVIMLALSAVGGVTYSWFSDTDEADINVTTGNISVSSSFKNIDVGYADGRTDDEYIGTTATPAANGLNISNLVANRFVKAEYDISINHSIPVKYRAYFDFSALKNYSTYVSIYVLENQNYKSMDLDNIVYLKGGENELVEPTSQNSPSNETITFKIVISESAQQISLPSNFTIKATVEAYQADASVAPVEPENAEFNQNITLTTQNPALKAESDNTGGIKSSMVVFDTSAINNLAGKQLMMDISNDGNFEVNGSKISLSLTDGTSNLGGTATITVGINGSVNDPTVTYVGSEESESMEVVNTVYDSTNIVTYITFVTNHFSDFIIKGVFFDSGDGTEDYPYTIVSAKDMLKISDHYEDKDSKYYYYKVKDGITVLDMTDIGKLKLYGSFDGNGVTMNNLTTALFEYVGKSGDSKDITISNLTANLHNIDGRALVRNIYNPGTTTFENVALHGYIEGQYNMGSFYNYGTANAGDSEGADYTVNFVNATSNVTLVCTSGNVMGGMLGHGYEGANYKLSVNMDANSKYTGTMYTTTGKDCYQVMAMCSHDTYILNGEEIKTAKYTYPSAKLTIVAPEAQGDGYYVAPVPGVNHYTVSLEAQLTAYDENNVKIPNMAGLTWSLGKTDITEGLDGKIFELFNSAEIVNGKDIPIGYEINDGKLNVYTGRDTNYASGWITLNVTQYNIDGDILATGNLRVHTFAEP